MSFIAHAKGKLSRRAASGKTVPHSPSTESLDISSGVDLDSDAHASPSPVAPDDWTDIDVHGTAYAQRCKELMELDRALRALGADMFLDVPRLTVIGGQSAGKSSLVEAVSGISVPRDSGICTRCPVELTMESADAENWSCSIALRWKYDNHGNEFGSPDTKDFGPILKDKSEVEIWLRRAQAAILSPHRRAEEFHAKSAQEIRDLSKMDKDMLPFSKNVVVVKLKDPDATDLSFVDLPGLIQNADPHLIALVRELVVERIKGKNNLILVTVPMSDDMENQQAVLLAKQEDREGQRTIGVLTKPDTLSQGASGPRNQWKQVLLGNAHKLELGYYCVRLPDDDERARGVGRAESQKIAADFFDNTAPWNEIPSRKRLGIPGFVADISHLLVQMIEMNLPDMRQTVDKLLEENTLALEKLPTQPTREPAVEILLRISHFCNDIDKAVMGEAFRTLVQTNREHYDHFKHCIQATCPDFRPFDHFYLYTDPGLRETDPGMGKPFAHMSSRAVTHEGETMDLTHVRKVIASSVTWELPKHVPFSATRELIMGFTKHWQSPAVACFDAVHSTLTDFLSTLISQQFEHFHNLQELISMSMRAELEKCKVETLEFIKKLLALETQPVYTQNYHYLDIEKVKWQEKFRNVKSKSSRYSMPPKALDYHSDVDSVPISRCASPIMIPPMIFQESVNTDYHEELLVMATVRAYFQVSYKRIIDSIPLAIEHQLQQPLAQKLRERLVEEISGPKGTRERMTWLLSEDPALAAQRSFLEERVARLTEIREKLYSF